MKILEKYTKETLFTEIKDIICNKCGNSCKGIANYCGLIEICVDGNYDSSVLEDGKKYEFSLCEKCLDSLFKDFKIHCNFKEMIHKNNDDKNDNLLSSDLWWPTTKF